MLQCCYQSSCLAASSDCVQNRFCPSPSSQRPGPPTTDTAAAQSLGPTTPAACAAAGGTPTLLRLPPSWRRAWRPPAAHPAERSTGGGVQDLAGVSRIWCLTLKPGGTPTNWDLSATTQTLGTATGLIITGHWSHTWLHRDGLRGLKIRVSEICRDSGPGTVSHHYVAHLH